MAHRDNHSRSSLALDPNSSMDPTRRRHPKPTPLIAPATVPAAAKSHHHTSPEPAAVAHQPSTIHNISNRFSKLYANHKKLASSNPVNPHSNPKLNAHFLNKTMLVSPGLNTSRIALTKSKSQHEVVSKVEKKEQVSSRIKVKEKEKDQLKKPGKKDSKKQPSLVAYDVKKASQLMSRSLESYQIKGFQQGFEGRRSSLTSLALDIGGRRKSFCSAYNELANVLSCSGVKVVAVDMPPVMQIHAVNCARKTHDSLEKFTSKTLAFTLKKEFDAEYGPAWHCIVGTSFGSFVTHSVGGFMYFSMDQKIYVLLFKTAVQKADSH